MAKHKTSELTGGLLDAAVAKACGMVFAIVPADSCHPVLCCAAGLNPHTDGMQPFHPSRDGGSAMLIIERARISLHPSYGCGPGCEWTAGCAAPTPAGCAVMDEEERHQQAGTPLVAAMRAYVASRFGDEVELP